MTVTLTSNFFANARGITFEDGGGLTWTINANTNQITATGSGGGVLSSVGLSDSSTTPIFTVGSSPLTANGTLTLTLSTQAAGKVFAGPATGSNAQPTFRTLVATDIPTLSYVTSIGSSNLSIGGTTAVPTVNLSSTQVTNIALGATALQTATTADSIQGAGTVASPIELVGDSAAPGNSKYYGTNGSGTRGWYTSATVPGSANPSGSIGLTAVNGTAATFMTSDSAPALSQAISPTWSGSHIFQKTVNISIAAGAEMMQLTTTIARGSNNSYVEWNDASGSAAYMGFTGGSDLSFVNQVAGNLFLGTSNITRITIASGGQVTVAGAMSVNGATPPAQVTGWGTATGNAAVINFPGGGPATLAQCSTAIAQIITTLKAFGLFGT